MVANLRRIYYHTSILYLHCEVIKSESYPTLFWSMYISYLGSEKQDKVERLQDTRVIPKRNISPI